MWTVKRSRHGCFSKGNGPGSIVQLVNAHAWPASVHRKFSIMLLAVLGPAMAMNRHTALSCNYCPTHEGAWCISCSHRCAAGYEIGGH